MTQDINTVDSSNDVKGTIEITVAGVKLRRCGKLFQFDTNGVEVEPGTEVVVETELGQMLGRVMTHPRKIEVQGELNRKILRKATQEDIEAIQKNRELEKDAKAYCIQKAEELNLEMKIVDTEITLDNRRIIFYFTADGRIDFRQLVRQLAARFKTRIEMRQIGVRDEVKMLGGLGVCGRQTCCSLFLNAFEPITIRMAKEQDLSINQNKLSGICGRLMCCLSYEYRELEEEEVDSGEFVTITDECSNGDLQCVDSNELDMEEPSPRGEESPQEIEERPVVEEEIKQEEEIPKESPAVETEPTTTQQEPITGTHPKRKRHKKGKAKKRAKTSRKGSEGPGSEKGKPFSRRKKFWQKKRH